MILRNLSQNPNVFDMDADKIRSEFEQANRVLGHIQKMLADYLETKRVAFPRFFFLSDEDLLDILARSRDPENFQRHLNKCFEAINSVDLTSKTNIYQCELRSMISHENEKVPFYEPIKLWRDPSVEKWMIEIEQNMKRTLRHQFRESYESRATTDSRAKAAFETWLFSWPGQVALMVESVNHTLATEDAIRLQTLPKYERERYEEMRAIVEMIRTDMSEL